MWLKIKVWTKVTLAVVLALYVLLFVYNNTGRQIQFWWWFNHTQESSVFTLSLVAFLSGGVVAILIRTTWKTIKQIREMQRRSHQQRVERELADMKSKAGMLKTRSGVFVAPAPATTTLPPAPPEA